MDYQEFLNKKINKVKNIGFEVKELNKNLFDFQKEIVKWALKKGRSAIFADCGLGKTLMQLEWAYRVWEKEQKPIIILAPLAVGSQTQEEGKKFKIDTKIVSSSDEIINGINITNYEKLDKFNPDDFIGIVLDESSIIKSFTGKFRKKLIEDYHNIKYKLACTATPSPNDFTEIGNHAQFLNVCTMQEMLSMYFINDMMGKKGTGDGGWRLKGHAEDSFWEFVGSFAVMIQKPSDLGYENKGFDLPKLNIIEHLIEDKTEKQGLFTIPAEGFNDIRKARKESLEDRCQKTAKLIDDKQWLIWCDYNDEGKRLKEIIPDSVEVKGSDSNEFKRKAMMDFSDGKIKVLITKAKIAGFGMNWQNCFNMAFCGLSYSYESFYQSTRRCWRFGQKNDVNVHIILTEKEIKVLEAVKLKQENHKKMNDKVINNVKKYFNNKYKPMEYKKNTIEKQNYKIMLGDSCERIKEIDDNSVDYSVYSPPFASLYTYSNSERDMGNCKNKSEFFDHFEFLAGELLRVIKPGRNMSFHCMNLPTLKMNDGFIGINDFRGDLIRIFEKVGFIYHSEVVIWKNPVTAMQRTKALGLLHKQIKKDSVMCRQGIPDYVVTMRKQGDNKEPITHTNENFPVDEWQKYASPVWMDINQSDTLQKESAREDKDEKHICPLQLEVIKRCVYLWSNPNDLVFSPFMGIGSEGYQSLKCGRRFIGIELKESYFNQSKLNLDRADNDKKQINLF